MKVQFVNSVSSREKADCIIIPAWQGKKTAEVSSSAKLFKPLVQEPISLGDFSAKADETMLLYAKQGKEKRLLLVGFGKPDKIDVDILRHAFAAAIVVCKKKKLQKIHILLPEEDYLKREDMVRGVFEGVFLTNYSFEKWRKEKDEKTIPSISFIGLSKNEQQLARKKEKIAKGVFLVRDLVNDNADEVTPQYLGKVAKSLEKLSPKLKTTIFDKKRIVKEKMGLLLAVNRGSSLDPAFITISYKGNPSSKDHSVIIGKGITYDSGGLSLKPPSSMETMRTDMAGAAAVLGTMHIIADLKMPINVTAIIPATENSIGSKSYKPGDVYVSYSGKTVEVLNTDAEGRLVLADAISYAVKNIKPSRIIDLATLTGAIVVALGEDVTGMFTNDDMLAKQMEEASRLTGEWTCRLPLYKRYNKLIHSEAADIKNVGGRGAGSITAALFLEAFVEKTPWMHLDIAGSSYFHKPKGYHLAFGTGAGTRLLIKFFENLVNNKQ